MTHKNKTVNRAGFLLLALMLSIGCVVAAEIIATRIQKDGFGFNHTVLSDGSEAYGVWDCEISDHRMTVTGGDPHFSVSTYGQVFSRVRITFTEPTDEDKVLKIYYVPVNGSVSEQDSIVKIIEKGSRQAFVYIPGGAYESLRMDFEQDIRFEGIYIGDQEWTILPYRLHPLRIVIVFAVIFLPLFALIRKRGKQNNKQPSDDQQNKEPKETEQPSEAERQNRRKRPRWPNTATVLCGLFLTLTACFFQPMAAILSDSRFLPVSFGNTWLLQLLLSIGAAFILSLLARLLPPKAERTVSAVCLGLGIAFLIQSLLFNENRPLPMNTNWPMEMLNIHVWFGIVIIVAAESIHYARNQETKAETSRSIAAWILIAIQVINLTIMATCADLSDHTEGQSYVAGTTILDMEKQVLSISMEQGLPELMKNNWLDL